MVFEPLIFSLFALLRYFITNEKFISFKAQFSISFF